MKPVLATRGSRQRSSKETARVSAGSASTSKPSEPLALSTTTTTTTTPASADDDDLDASMAQAEAIAARRTGERGGDGEGEEEEGGDVDEDGEGESDRDIDGDVYGKQDGERQTRDKIAHKVGAGIGEVEAEDEGEGEGEGELKFPQLPPDLLLNEDDDGQDSLEFSAHTRQNVFDQPSIAKEGAGSSHSIVGSSAAEDLAALLGGGSSSKQEATTIHQGGIEALDPSLAMTKAEPIYDRMGGKTGLASASTGPGQNGLLATGSSSSAHSGRFTNTYDGYQDRDVFARKAASPGSYSQIRRDAGYARPSGYPQQPEGSYGGLASTGAAYERRDQTHDDLNGSRVLQDAARLGLDPNIMADVMQHTGAGAPTRATGRNHDNGNLGDNGSQSWSPASQQPRTNFDSNADPDAQFNAHIAAQRSRMGKLSGSGSGPISVSCPHPGCTKSFNRPYNLKAHMRSSHSNSKPFGCPRCNRSFSRKHDLQRHIRTHTGDRPYLCTNCNTGFPRSDALRRHFKLERECALVAEQSRESEGDKGGHGAMLYL